MKRSYNKLGRKIIVVGSPGSGKSYIAKAIAKATGLTIYHLDMLYWNQGWIETPKEIFEDRIYSILKTDSYIIDGNYKSTFDMRFAACDTVVFMDLPTRVCLKRERERRNIKRSDFPKFLEEKEDKEFIDFIKGFRKSGRKVILEYIKKYSTVLTIILKSKRQTDEYVTFLGNNI